MDLYEKKQIRYKYILLTVLLVCIASVVSAYFTYYYFCGEKVSLSLIGKSSVKSEEDSDENIENIANALKGFRSIIDSQFKGEIDENKLLDGAIKGYVERIR